jgi:hypothetical protein
VIVIIAIINFLQLVITFTLPKLVTVIIPTIVIVITIAIIPTTIVIINLFCTLLVYHMKQETLLLNLQVFLKEPKDQYHRP